MRDYIIVQNLSLDSLVETVRAKLREGYVALGAPFVYQAEGKQRLGQAMYLPDVVPPN